MVFFQALIKPYFSDFLDWRLYGIICSSYAIFGFAIHISIALLSKD